MAILDECTALDRAAICESGPYCLLVSGSLTTTGLEIASIGESGPFRAEEGTTEGGGTSGAIVRVAPGFSVRRVYPAVPAARVFPL